ncbi:hypothetical protein AXK11_06870 [Cephaloticoccus primus]|uniref:Addiction module protein n=1 Tax=Cephaloticoccus primus TaxID=1548207 RepID=A0A139SKI4_9BACT|nr:addiction module protein [Cephaloticoccus primus]KXU35072.1 hypothetical protein AXK11_06870 [Cephaloticoccus primus]
MLNAQIAHTALSLPEEDRRELAQQLIESLGDDFGMLSDEEIVEEAARRYEELRSGAVQGLTLEEHAFATR